MRHGTRICLICLVIGVFFAGPAQGITISPSTTVPQVGQSVTFATQWAYQPSPGCNDTLFIGFGDGSSSSSNGTCVNLGSFRSCGANFSHAYNAPGTYTASASSQCAAPPNPASALVSVQCPQAPIFTSPGALPAASAGSPYSYQLQASGGVLPYFFGTPAGVPANLPPGLVLSNSGLISGAPTVPGSYTFQVFVSDACPTALGVVSNINVTRLVAKNFTINVGCPSPSIVTPSLPPATVGQAYRLQFQATGGRPPYSWSSFGKDPLPAGMTLSASGLLSGIPRVVGVNTIDVAVQDSCAAASPGFANRVFGFTVGCPALLFNPSSTLPPGTQGTIYTHQLTAAGGQGNRVFSISSGSLPSGLSLSPSGLISGTPGAAGTFSLTVRVSDTCPLAAQSVERSLTLLIAPGAVSCTPIGFISAPPLSAGTVGQAYSSQILSTGGQPPVSFSLVAGALAPGLSLNPAGMVTGTPLSAGSYSFTVRATDSCVSGLQASDRTFALTVNPPVVVCPVFDFATPGTLTPARSSAPYSLQFQTLGGSGAVSYRVVGGTLPSGLTVGQGGLLSGTPTEMGTYTFTVRATDSCPRGAQEADRVFVLRVDSQTISITVAPSSINIPRRSASSHTVAYRASGSAALTAMLRSETGLFLAGGEMLGESGIPLLLNVSGGNGTTEEALSVPVGVTRRAEELGQTVIIYQRTFADAPGPAPGAGGISVVARLNLRLTTPGTAEFNISRIELSFSGDSTDGSPKATVKRNDRSLKGHAKIRFEGTGLLRGYWEVDGRILSQVNQHLVYGQSVRLETPAQPPLPTFDEGTHRLRLVLTSPAQDIPFPEAIYFVTGEDAGDAGFFIRLSSPEDLTGSNMVRFPFPGRGGARQPRF